MYRTVAQLDSVMQFLATFFPDICTREELPHRSVLGRPIFALRIHAGTATNRRAVLIVGGMHARELMNPDAIVELQLGLVQAYLNETGLRFGNRRWSADEIRVMLESLDVWTLPCANPDGREYCQTVDDLWRKNRRDHPDTPDDKDGVDTNRNSDIVWGVTNPNTSCFPASIQYCGTARFSEPESLNIKAFCDAHRVNVYLDVHSYSELVMFPWGHTRTQTNDPTKRFTSLATGTCAPLNPSGHQEYMTPRDKRRYEAVARQIADDIKAVRGRTYRTGTIHDIVYAATGTSTDYVYSRHIANPGLRKTYGFAFETGPNTGNEAESFHPADPTLIKRDTKAGILSLLQQSVCAIEVIGASLARSRVAAVRNVRDQRLATTTAGRKLIALFERVQTPLLTKVLADESLAREAAGLLERAQALLEDDAAIVSDRDVTRALGFVDALYRTASSAIRRDLATVRQHLGKASGKRVGAVLASLVAAPRRRPAARKSRKPVAKRKR